MKTLAAPALLLLFLSGCYFGKQKDDRPWSPDQLARLQVGKTTKAEVLQVLGPPRQVVRLLDSEAFMYTHAVEKSTNSFMVVLNLHRSDRQYDAITVLVGRDGIVQAVGSRFAAEESSYGTPWGD
jgi:outer membrane protein assembly factor BamE (lipoprotein component of BamABCDE complex)